MSHDAIAKDYGVDLEVRRIERYGNKRIDLGTILDLQLKASINWELEESHVVFDLEADAYNRLIFRRENSSTKCALVLCCLPKDSATWIDACEDELKIKKCCYYYFPDGEESKNVRSQRIRISRAQLLTSTSLTYLISSLISGEQS